MISLNNKEYKLLFLDTNAIREITNNHNSCGKVFFEKFFLNETKYIPCFSIYNIIELKPWTDKYEIFLDFFSKTPCILISPYRLLLEQEEIAYKNKHQLPIENLILKVFPNIISDNNIRRYIQNVWEQQPIADSINDEILKLNEVIEVWENQKIDMLKILKRLKLPKEILDEEFYKKEEKNSIINFLKSYEITLNINSDIKQFPGARIMLYSQYKRLYSTERKITPNDVMDIKISCIIPYIDAVITEKFQADVYKKAKKHIRQINDLEIYTLKDIKLTN